MNHKKIGSSAILAAALLQWLLTSAYALEFTQTGNEITLKTKRLEAVVRDARIVQLKYRGDDTLLADRAFDEISDTAGLGCITKSLESRKLLSRYHRKFGDPKATLDSLALGPVELYRSPCEKSIFHAQKNENGVFVSWKGLFDGKTFFPDDLIEIEFGEDANGALTFRGMGTAPDGGVFAVQIPVENLSPRGRFILPVFGGMEYSASEGDKTLMTFMSTCCFYDAPLMTYELGKHALGMWSEDGDFHPQYAFFRRGERSCAFSLEFLTLIPYEVRKTTRPPVIKIDIFPDNGWIEAARPYRDWYQKTFAKEIGERDGSWFNEIQAIMEYGAPAPVVMHNDARRIASLFDPKKILVHWWSFRKWRFDRDQPDYTLHENTAAYVKDTQRLGFRNSAYFNPICANYNSEAFKRDDLRSFVLTRKNTVASYKTGMAGDIDESLGGTIEQGSEKNPFDGIAEGALMYLDPLSKGWREYIVKVNEQALVETGLDAFYHDCLGVCEDVGNGTVNGIAGPMANAELARLLQKVVKAPFWSEYGPACVAFATSASLIGAGWYRNSPEFIRQRIHKQYPLSAFLFGYRTADHQTDPGDMIMHSHAATMDSLSGLALLPPDPFSMEKGFKDHIWLCCKVYMDYDLKPFYPECRYPENIRAMYKAKDGSIFRYYDDGQLQMMLDASAHPLYGRFDGGTEIKSKDLNLPGWPCMDENGIYGLNPESSYALFPKTNKTGHLSVTLAKPEGDVRIKFYYETADFAYLEIMANSPDVKTAKLSLNVSGKYKTISVNDHEMPAEKSMLLEADLPARLVFAAENISDEKPIVREISMTGGLEHGVPEKLDSPCRVFKGKNFYQPSPGYFKSIDFLHKVVDPQSALEFHAQFDPPKGRDYNGAIVSILVNGMEIKSFDSAPEKNPAYKRGADNIPRYRNDYDMHKWILPIGKYHGKTVLVSLRIDNKKNSTRDRMRVTIPEIIRDPAQKITETIEETVPVKLYE